MVRGFNCSGDNQDGGKEKEGVVLEVTEHEGVPHSGAVVSWDCGGKNNYRLGYQGKVRCCQYRLQNSPYLRQKSEKRGF